MATSLSGWEIVDQEKCKLIYAKFFDGVQCYDAARNQITLTTPDFEQTTYDPTTKKLSTPSFSVRPVTPVSDLTRPIVFVSIESNITALEVTLIADDYTKTRIIPMYYLDVCNSYTSNGLDICLDIFDNSIVTKLYYTEGSVEFISNTVFKYIDKDSVAHLYKLKDFNKVEVAYEIPTIPSNFYYLPESYYTEEVPPEYERAIVNGYNYMDSYSSYDMNIYPCTLDIDSLNSIFSSSIQYIEQSENEWQFNIVMYKESGWSFDGSNLRISLLLQDKDTKQYYTKQYRCFFEAKKGAINLENHTSIVKVYNRFDSYSQNIGIANCSGQYTVYEINLDNSETFLKIEPIPTYGYPGCEDLGMYSYESCLCEGADKCWDKYWLPCEECNPETGEITDVCTTGHCTIFGCLEDVLYTPCLCATTSSIEQGFPFVQALFTDASCFTLPYMGFRLYKNGDVLIHMDISMFVPEAHAGLADMPWLKAFNINDLIETKAYQYSSKVLTVDPFSFILMEKLGFGFDEIDSEYQASLDNFDYTSARTGLSRAELDQATQELYGKLDDLTPGAIDQALREYKEDITARPTSNLDHELLAATRPMMTLKDIRMAEYINISRGELTEILPSFEQIAFDWASFTTNSFGSSTATNRPCAYMSVEVKVERMGKINYHYRVNQGLFFIYPDIVNPQVVSNPELQTAYDNYCEKIKFFGDTTSYTYGLYLKEIEKSGLLTI